MYYSVNLLYKSERTDNAVPLWEERIILISAIDEGEAEEKALRYAKNEEAEFSVSNSADVVWRFYKIERVYFVGDEINDGAELFSRFLRDSEARSILTPFDD